VSLRTRVLLTVFVLSISTSLAQSPPDHPDPTALLHDLVDDFSRLAPQTIRPADGYIKHPYLVPSGYYPQMWDWDGFFIGLHWANQDPANAGYLRDWVLSFAGSADADGYVAGCITPKGPRPLFGKFAMKPFLAQGALIASRDLNDYEWLRPVWPAMKRIVDYRRRTQFDQKWSLWFWDNAMQSGADNNPALTNDEHDRSAILAVDASVWAMREYQAMAVLAHHLDDTTSARVYQPMHSPLVRPSAAISTRLATRCSGIAAATPARSFASSPGPISCPSLTVFSRAAKRGA
jgi:alpha,alpha-trehalase